MKIYITRKLPIEAEQVLKAKGFNVTVFSYDRAITRKEIISGAKNCDALISLVSDPIDRFVIDGLKKVKIIANYAVGYNNIDVAYANSKGIVVTNTPDVLTNSTADLTMSLVMACARRIIESDTFMRNREFSGWKPELLLGMELKGKIFGIVGAGEIGRAVARRAKAFGCKIIYYNRSKKTEFEKELGAKKVSLNKLLETSDIISVNISLSEATYHLLNKSNMNLIKKGSVFVNTARGEVIDETHLIKMIKKKHFLGVGLDVYENEPNIREEFYDITGVVLLPHIGSATVDARKELSVLAAKNVVNVLSGKKPLTPVKLQ